MIRTPMNLNYLKRTIRPLYANTQATPKATFLDPAWLAAPTLDIYPGMALMKISSVAAGGQVVRPVDGTGYAYGLADFFEAPTLGIRQISDSGINACATWVLDDDAEFQVLPPAFDSSLGWATAMTGNTAGANLKVFYYTSTAKQGQLAIGASAGVISTVAVARLLDVSGTGANAVITIGGLPGVS